MVTMAALHERIDWNGGLIRRYDRVGPRYTSYPTAPQFSAAFSDDDFHAAVARSNAGGRPLSLYFHLPFCDTLCYYCGCNKVVTRTRGRAQPYLHQLEHEMAMQAALFDERPVKQLHWGGGTPTFISHDEMSGLMAATRRHFRLSDDDSGEYAVEIHPGRVAVETMAHLRRLGFNRVSMGVQDFDERVQQAVNRYNSVEQVTLLMRALRQQGYHSVSMDLIYGLPLQTPASVAATLERVVELAPDRLSLFNYAHMPHLFKSQRLICEEDLPSPRQKLEILHLAIERLQDAGYVYIGMDHFALPGDGLVQAQREGRLQRNFQGYATHGDCDLLGFGVSAISSFGDAYVQNAKSLVRYQEQLAEGLRPIARGFHLSAEDRLRRYVIGQLICHFQLDFAVLRDHFDIDPERHFAAELARLQPMLEDGLVELGARGIRVLNTGRLLIRRICMVFDAYLEQDGRARYSKVI
jgi:oxygen-independent coproporphyrinogen-3 oxidase